MESTILVQETYFNELTSNDIKKNFIKNMYLTLLPKVLLIYGSLYLPYFEYCQLFFRSSFSEGFFIIFFYILFISTVLLYSNFNDIHNQNDLTSYSHLFTMCFSYIFTYLTYYLHTQFFIFTGDYLIALILTIICYTYQNNYSFTYNNLIKMSFISQLSVLFILTMIYNNFEYIFFTYLTSSIAKLFIIYDTESIVSSTSRRFNIRTTDFLSGSMVLYLDLFNIFPFIINLFIGR